LRRFSKQNSDIRLKSTFLPPIFWLLPNFSAGYTTVSATGRFGDGGRRCFIREKCVLEIPQLLNYEGCLLDKHSVVILRAGVVSLPPVVWKSLVWPWPCVEGNMACDVSFCWAWGVCEFTQKLSLDGNYGFSFHLIILIAFHR